MPPVLKTRALARYFLLSSGSVILSGCLLSPEYVPPTTRLPASYSITAPVRSDPKFTATWWESFKDPALSQIVEQAFSQNLDLAQARERVKEAYATARATAPATDLSGRVEAISDTNGADGTQASATFLIDLFGGKRKRAEAARARADAAAYGAQNARLVILSGVANAYVDLRFQQASLTHKNKDIRSRRKTLRDITTLLESGEATRLDQIRAQALLAEARAEIPPLTTEIARQRNRLSTLVGTPAGSEGAPVPGSGSQPQPTAISSAGIPADLIRTRPDIRQAERLYAAAVSETGAAEAARYPSLSLSGKISHPLSGDLSQSGLYAAGLNIPIFAQGSLKAAVDAQQSRAKQAFLEWRSRVLAAVEEVETALVAVNGSHATVAEARKVLALNEESLSLSRQLLGGRGNATILDLLDRERSVTSSRARLAQARRQLARDHIALNVALGLGSAVVETAQTN